MIEKPRFWRGFLVVLYPGTGERRGDGERDFAHQPRPGRARRWLGPSLAHSPPRAIPVARFPGPCLPESNRARIVIARSGEAC
jgi:hypothetical protein